ncbi:MAG: hypothetical protein K0S12_1395, partial [Bacteroidetes bacterium]|nr:hypothetical protein [Bacteroidota bacterium]
MKKNVRFLLFLFLVFAAYALRCQDIIVKTSGDSIRAKITDVGTETVSYKKQSMPDGPGFTINKSEVSFILFANGERENFNAIKPSVSSTPSVAPQEEKQETKKIKI